MGLDINKSKIGKLLQEYPSGLVLLPSWLLSEGYSYELQQQYRKEWLVKINRERCHVKIK